MSEGADLQPTWVVMADIQYKDFRVEHNFAMVNTAKHTLVLRNDFIKNVGFMVDQKESKVYQTKEQEVAWLATSKSQCFC